VTIRRRELAGGSANGALTPTVTTDSAASDHWQQVTAQASAAATVRP
jgi:hypothetical protein